MGEPTQESDQHVAVSDAQNTAVAAESSAAAQSSPDGSTSSEFGRVDEHGNVYLNIDGEEKLIGQYVAGTPEEAFQLYTNRYTDIVSQITLLTQRIDHVRPDEAFKELDDIAAKLTEPAMIGDIAGARARVEATRAMVSEHKKQHDADRRAAREQATAEREALVAQAEELAHQDPEHIHWKNTRTRMTELFDEWKAAQRRGPRLERKTEEELWHRLSHARSYFDKARRQHFSQLDQDRAQIAAHKQQLIDKAEELSTSTDWNRTSAQYRELMDEWRSAGHLARKDDDKYWERFRAAEQKFFDARRAHFAARDDEFAENLRKKLDLVAQAQALLPISDIEQARKALADIEDQWDEIGMVPRGDINRTEGKLREVADAIRAAESEQWRRTDPEKQNRSDGMAAQLKRLIAQIDDELVQAREAGNEKKIKELEDSRAARVAWLETVQQKL
ncbi:MAG: DUF349 domain-containing protein [Actinomycetaceae bacterium]|nr:DUF349 domain-containing protein [Actinomycetaceae bacterium]